MIKKTKEINILKESPERCVDKFIEYFWMGKKTSKRHPRKDKFLNDLIKTIKAIDEKAISNYNESAVKQFILVPLLKNLGWKISPSEISFDYWINLKKVDYILENNKKFKTCIEVKSLGSQLDFDAEENLLNYALNGNFRMAVLTDGNDWRFFYFKNKDYYGDSKFKIKNKIIAAAKSPSTMLATFVSSLFEPLTFFLLAIRIITIFAEICGRS